MNERRDDDHHHHPRSRRRDCFEETKTSKNHFSNFEGKLDAKTFKCQPASSIIINDDENDALVKNDFYE